MKVIRDENGRERINAATQETEEYELRYLVDGANNRDEAFTAVLREAPVWHKGMYRQSVSFDGYEGDGFPTFSVSYVYRGSSAFSDSGESRESTISFDCSGGTKHITHSTEPARMIKGDQEEITAIGWNGKTGADMEITGVDIPVGAIRESYTRIVKMSRLSTAYRRKVAALVGKVNNASFKGWEAGEVMFLGMSFNGSLDSQTLIQVTYNFQIQPNETGIKVGNVPVTKKGFEYVWVYWKSEADVTSLKTSIAPDGIYVSKVAEAGDFGVLGV